MVDICGKKAHLIHNVKRGGCTCVGVLVSASASSTSMTMNSVGHTYESAHHKLKAAR